MEFIRTKFSHHKLMPTVYGINKIKKGYAVLNLPIGSVWLIFLSLETLNSSHYEGLEF